MTTEYDDLLARLDTAAARSTLTTLASETAAAIRALTAQAVERDAVIEQVGQVVRQIGLHIQSEYDEDRGFNALVDELEAATSQAPRDALAAHDKTVRATALREAAEDVKPGTVEFQKWRLRARADQEEAQR